MDPTQQFMQATGTTDPNQAASLLSAADGDVNLAIALYQSSVTSKPAQATAAQQPAPVSKPKPKPTGGIMTMSQLTALDTGDDDDDDGEDYFAGGAKNSGVAVHGPGKGKKEQVAKVVEGVFERARAGGAKTDDEQHAEDSKAFTGSGHRLGDTNAAGPSRPTVQGRPERLKKVVTFYRQGFVVADGPLRPYSDPANHAFLKDVQDGYVPRELEAEAAGRELETELVDCKNEDYKEPDRPRYNAFAGSGHSLGSSASTSAPAPAPVAAASNNFQLDTTAPTISVQVRFHDGSKATAKLNTTHTIMDLRAWIEQQKPVTQAYDLMLAFPPKPLTDLSQTVSAAGLAGAAVNQKLR